VNTAKRLISVQGVLETADAWNIETPQKEVYERVVSLEVRLERIIEGWVLAPINAANKRAEAKAIAKAKAKRDAQRDVYLREQEAKQVQQIQGTEPVFYGYCHYCDRSVGGWLGAGFGSTFTGDMVPRVTCNYCEGKDLDESKRSQELAKTLVREILNSGWCWHCKADIDEQLLDHECGHDDCGYDAVSVGQRRFCAECSESNKVIPIADLVEIARKVWDPTGTLDYFRLNA